MSKLWFIELILLLPVYIWMARMMLIDDKIPVWLRLVFSGGFLGLSLALATLFHAAWGE